MKEEIYITIRVDDVMESAYTNSEGTFIKIDKDLISAWITYLKELYCE